MAMLFLFCGLSLWLSNAMNVPYAAGRKILAKERRQAQLPCFLSPQPQESSSRKLYEILAVHWMKQGNRKNYLMLKVEPSGIRKLARSMMYRATVLDSGLLSRNFSILIKPLLEDDAGTYQTLVKNGNEIWHCQFQISVVSVIANPQGPLVESEPIQLTCNSTHPGRPTKISWFHRGLLPHASGRFHSLDQSLFISRSVSSDSGIWICELTYADGGRFSATHNLEFIGFVAPSVPVIYTAVGSDACLPCTLNYNPLDQGVSGVVAHWTYKARGEEKATFALSKGNHNNCSLCLATVSTDDAGQYTCEVTVRGTTISNNVTLTVMTVIPSITGPVFEGSHLRLTCSLTNYTGDERFQWKQLNLGHPNKTLSDAAVFNTPEVLHQGWTLEFLQVSPNDAGTWECSVHRPGGILGSVQHHLEIAGAQKAMAQPNITRKTIFGLTLFLILLIFTLLLIYLRRRVQSSHFPALDRKFPLALPKKAAEGRGQEEKTLQILH